MDSDKTFYAKTLFYQGSYLACHSTISAMNEPSFQLILFSARSLISLKKFEEAIDLLEKFLDSQPSARALTLLAKFHQKNSTTDAEREKFSEDAEALTEEIADEENDGIDSVLRVTLATLLILLDNVTLAIFLLKQGVQLKSLEAVALLVSLYLSPRIRRPDLARALYRSAKSWADDAILLQMAEAWISAITGSAAGSASGKDPGGYQSAFYVFDEMTNTSTASPDHVNVNGLNGKAVTQLAMGHVDEAQANLVEALRINPEDESALANAIVIRAHLDSEDSETSNLLEKLKSINPRHPLIVDLDQHSILFDEAAKKFVSSTA
ncbi:hypothetical protein O181_016545 [Austropuccinia psidii MF-1]|uniref:Coatomer subunit epsilon n=1 Tax=Austropuccinia psidii MF-1 TaxID=1389203 RepID=A0A9Q3GS32_9BASI|nr:hypothetical protein [Austropuccinia psidii MF-1]